MAPFVLKNINAYFAIVVNIGMKQLGFELEDWWLVRVIIIEIDLQAESASFPYGVERTIDDCFPMIDVIFIGSCVYPLVITVFDLIQILQQLPLRCCRHQCDWRTCELIN